MSGSLRVLDGTGDGVSMGYFLLVAGIAVAALAVLAVRVRRATLPRRRPPVQSILARRIEQDEAMIAANREELERLATKIERQQSAVAQVFAAAGEDEPCDLMVTQPSLRVVQG